MIKKGSRFPKESGSPFRSLQADLRAGEGVVLVRDEKDDLLPCGPRDAALRRGAVVRVESGERLVERERVRGREQGAREGQTALHAAGPVPHPLVSHLAEPQLREQGARGGLVVSRAEREAQVARGVELFEQAVLLKTAAQRKRSALVVPPSARSSPSRMRSSVVLPMPELPVTRVRPISAVKLTPCSTAVPP